MQDCKERGRVWHSDGELSTKAKLTNQKVLEIRNRLSLGEKPRDLAEEFGVAEAYISQIRHRKTWKHI